AEDDPMVLSLHVQALSQIEGFEIAATVSDGQQLLDFFNDSSADLIIMDIYMPRMNGLEALEILREKGQNADVILVSAGKKGEIVNTARKLGAFDYMIKPYSFRRFRASLQSYLSRKALLPASTEDPSQETLDVLFEIPFSNEKLLSDEELPKGLQKETLELIMRGISSVPNSSAEEIAAETSISRSTARRYLEYLLEKKLVETRFEYRAVGRPVKRYTLVRKLA
ncbi:MAG: response regulator, partial [Synergistaceae bacterium]|nr:response regulator [Synergistaceae bacterium]